MAGLLNIVPRYLPRYGMAPDWSRAARPMVLVFTAISFAITLLLRRGRGGPGRRLRHRRAGPDPLGGGRGHPVGLERRPARPRPPFGVVALIFAYTTVANIIERPDGLKIALFFVLAIVVTSLISRATRSTELRVTRITLDDQARRYSTRPARDPPHRQRAARPRLARSTSTRIREAWELPPARSRGGLLFLEVTVADASEFARELRAWARSGTASGSFAWRARPRQRDRGATAAPARRDRQDARTSTSTGPRAIRSVRCCATCLRRRRRPPLTREVLRQAEPDAERRPLVHVG